MASKQNSMRSKRKSFQLWQDFLGISDPNNIETDPTTQNYEDTCTSKLSWKDAEYFGVSVLIKRPKLVTCQKCNHGNPRHMKCNHLLSHADHHHLDLISSQTIDELNSSELLSNDAKKSYAANIIKQNSTQHHGCSNSAKTINNALFPNTSLSELDKSFPRTTNCTETGNDCAYLSYEYPTKNKCKWSPSSTGNEYRNEAVFCPKVPVDANNSNVSSYSNAMPSVSLHNNSTAISSNLRCPDPGGGPSVVNLFDCSLFLSKQDSSSDPLDCYSYPVIPGSSVQDIQPVKAEQPTSNSALFWPGTPSLSSAFQISESHSNYMCNSNIYTSQVTKKTEFSNKNSLASESCFNSITEINPTELEKAHTDQSDNFLCPSAASNYLQNKKLLVGGGSKIQNNDSYEVNRTFCPINDHDCDSRSSTISTDSKYVAENFCDAFVDNQASENSVKDGYSILNFACDTQAEGCTQSRSSSQNSIASSKGESGYKNWCVPISQTCSMPPTKSIDDATLSENSNGSHKSVFKDETTPESKNKHYKPISPYPIIGKGNSDDVHYDIPGCNCPDCESSSLKNNLEDKSVSTCEKTQNVIDEQSKGSRSALDGILLQICNANILPSGMEAFNKKETIQKNCSTGTMFANADYENKSSNEQNIFSVDTNQHSFLDLSSVDPSCSESTEGLLLCIPVSEEQEAVIPYHRPTSAPLTAPVHSYVVMSNAGVQSQQRKDNVGAPCLGAKASCVLTRLNNMKKALKSQFKIKSCECKNCKYDSESMHSFLREVAAGISESEATTNVLINGNLPTFTNEVKSKVLQDVEVSENTSNIESSSSGAVEIIPLNHAVCIKQNVSKDVICQIPMQQKIDTCSSNSTKALVSPPLFNICSDKITGKSRSNKMHQCSVYNLEKIFHNEKKLNEVNSKIKNLNKNKVASFLLKSLKKSDCSSNAQKLECSSTSINALPSFICNQSFEKIAECDTIHASILNETDPDKSFLPAVTPLSSYSFSTPPITDAMLNYQNKTVLNHVAYCTRTIFSCEIMKKKTPTSVVPTDTLKSAHYPNEAYCETYLLPMSSFEKHANKLSSFKELPEIRPEPLLFSLDALSWRRRIFDLKTLAKHRMKIKRNTKGTESCVKRALQCTSKSDRLLMPPNLLDASNSCDKEFKTVHCSSLTDNSSKKDAFRQKNLKKKMLHIQNKLELAKNDMELPNLGKRFLNVENSVLCSISSPYAETSVSLTRNTTSSTVESKSNRKALNYDIQTTVSEPGNANLSEMSIDSAPSCSKFGQEGNENSNFEVNFKIGRRPTNGLIKKDCNLFKILTDAKEQQAAVCNIYEPPSFGRTNLKETSACGKSSNNLLDTSAGDIAKVLNNKKLFQFVKLKGCHLGSSSFHRKKNKQKFQ